MSTLSRWAVAAAVAGLSLVAPAGTAWPEAAGPAPEPRLDGRFVYAHALGHGRDLVDRAFDAALRELNPILRGRAAVELTCAEPLARAVVIAVDGPRVSVRFEADRTVTFSTTLGVAEPVVTATGRQVTLVQRLTRSGLEQLFEAPRARQRNLLRLADSGATLHLATTIESPELRRPVRLHLEYRRSARSGE